MYAVTIGPLHAMVFLSEPPENGHWEVQEGVQIDIPANYSDRPEEADAPEQILCVSIFEPKRYKVFRSPRDIDPAEFRETGMNFGGVFSRTAWERFAKSLSATLAEADAVDDEPPGANDAAVRAIKGER
jgi:hypothetical protein